VSPVALLPALSLIIGAAAGTFSGSSFAFAVWVLPVSCVASIAAWRLGRGLPTVALLSAGFAAAGGAVAADAREQALRPSLRSLMHAEIGGFDIDRQGPEHDHDPLPVRARLIEDAAPREEFVSLRVRVVEVFSSGAWQRADGGVVLTVSGAAAAERVLEWRAERMIEASVSFRRPARYLNEGVPDVERDLALDGTTLFGSVKSALLVDVTARGTWTEEKAADLRAHVRNAVGRWIAPGHPVAGAIVIAVLIGDRTGLPDVVRDRLQAAGTYHVIAISGGNIAILAGLVLGLLMLTGAPPRAAAAVAIATLLAYAQVATAGPSVWRATLMAVLYLGARLLDHRTAPWQAAGMAAALMVVAHPLDIRDPGFILTFGATVALLEGARRGHALLPKHRLLAWLLASLAASLATEIALLPVSAQTFSRVTSAGLLLNLVAVPMMGVAQVAGIAVVVCDSVGWLAAAAGWVALGAATALVESARLVDAAPWLASRVPPPGLALIVIYYAALVATLCARRVAPRALAMLALVAAIAAIAGFVPHMPVPSSSGLRLTMFDVGQAEAILVEADGRTLLIDAGGAPFGSGSFDIGARVLAPALWARGLRRLDTLLTTHGDPDHVGGAAALIEDFAVEELWEGIEVPRHQPTRQLRARAAGAGVRLAPRRAGESFALGRARIRILHPPEPDWERPRIRNDDSVVLEIVYGDVALLLTGDIGADIERAIAPQLTPAPVRILKVAHHGSRTSTSPALLDAWPPHIALVSAGRANTFGHPAPEVIERLAASGTRIYRTDLHGQITLDTDGRDVQIRTFTGEGR
jgi:competence protein ComEC